MSEQYEIIVVGAGPAGYSLAIRLAQRGQRVACIEREAVGGVCLNWGCIPSKALISTAHRYTSAKTGATVGVLTDAVRLDLPAAQQHSRAVARHHTGGVALLLEQNGVRLVRGVAELESPQRVHVMAEDGTRVELEAARAVVVASGARPRTLPGLAPDGRRIVTAREAVFLEQLPERLAVVGGGVIGVELGSAYQSFGSQLSIVELGPALLPATDGDLVRVIERRLRRAGARIFTGTRVSGWQERGDGVRLSLASTSGESSIEADLVLVAAGFVPNTHGLGLERLGVALDAAGHIAVDARCESSVPGVYAIGDVAGPPYLAHKAYKEAELLAEVLCGKRVIREAWAVPNVIFSDPEIATVGTSETLARAEGRDIVIGKFPFSALGRARALGETEGFVKLIARNERLIGAAVVGPEASELIAELTLALEVGATLEDLALTIHAHPTLAEAIREAAEQGLGRSVHVANRRRPSTFRSDAGLVSAADGQRHDR